MGTDTLAAEGRRLLAPFKDAKLNVWLVNNAPELLTALEERDALRSLLKEAGEDAIWIEAFASYRSTDDSKTFALVNRGALRTIAERARSLSTRIGEVLGSVGMSPPASQSATPSPSLANEPANLPTEDGE